MWKSLFRRRRPVLPFEFELASSVFRCTALGAKKRDATHQLLREWRVSREMTLEWLVFDSFCVWVPIEGWLEKEHPAVLNQVYDDYGLLLIVAIGANCDVSPGLVQKLLSERWTIYKRVLDERAEFPIGQRPDTSSVLVEAFARMVKQPRNEVIGKLTRRSFEAMLEMIDFVMKRSESARTWITARLRE